MLLPAQSITLLDIQGAGSIQRIWMTLTDMSPTMLRSLVLTMFWDGEIKPAVSVPLGDFFGVGLGRTTLFQSALFSSTEGYFAVFHIQMVSGITPQNRLD